MRREDRPLSFTKTGTLKLFQWKPKGRQLHLLELCLAEAGERPRSSFVKGVQEAGLPRRVRRQRARKHVAELGGHIVQLPAKEPGFPQRTLCWQL